MIDFPAFVQGLFLVIVIALMITVILFFRKPATIKSFSKDSRALLLLMSIGGIFIVALLIGIKLSSWASGYKQAKSDFQIQQELDLNEYSYISRTFKPLEQEYRQLRASLEGLDKMIVKIKELKPGHKNHRPLLDNMLKTFSEEAVLQNELYAKINLQIRHAMILAATTQNAVSVQNQFYERAKVLHAKIINARRRMTRELGDTAGLLADSLIEARRKLNQKPDYPFKKHNDKKSKIVKLYSFSDKTTERLLEHLGMYDAELLAMTRQLIKVIIKARQNKDTMNVMSQREVKLKVPLQKTMMLWSDVEIKGQQYWGNILYSLEAAYLADQFNMPHHKPAYRSLMRDLKVVIPKSLNKLVTIHRDVESSFILPDFVEKNK